MTNGKQTVEVRVARHEVGAMFQGRGIDNCICGRELVFAANLCRSKRDLGIERHDNAHKISMDRTFPEALGVRYSSGSAYGLSFIQGSIPINPALACGRKNDIIDIVILLER